MKLNIHSSLAHFYRNFYDTPKLPDNLCSYFWKLVIAFICAPFIWPTIVTSAFTRPYRYSTETKAYTYGGENIGLFLGFLSNFIFLVLGFGFLDIFYGKGTSNIVSIWKIYVDGVMSAIIITAGFILFFHFLKFLIKTAENFRNKGKRYGDMTLEEKTAYWDEIERKKKEKEERRKKTFWYIAKQYFIAWKDKHCPRIEWEDNKLKTTNN